MNFDINWVAGLAAGVAAMLPGSVIYSKAGLGKQWLKSIGRKPKEMDNYTKAQKAEGMKAVQKMFLASLVNGLVASVLVGLSGAETVLDALYVTLLLSWFWISASLMTVFFENRSWMWFKISTLNHVLTAAVIGVVLGLFL